MNYWTTIRLVVLWLLVPGITPEAAEIILDQDFVEVCMDVAVRARIRGLEDFKLTTSQSDGSPGARYSGSDRFEVESNAPVRLIVEGTALSNGVHRLATSYSIDGKEDFIETGSGTHQGTHRLRAQTELGDISDQLAGEYSAGISITVMPLVSSVRSCRKVKRSNEAKKSTTEEATTEATLTVPETTVSDTTTLTPAHQLESAVKSLDPSRTSELIDFAKKVLENKTMNTTSTNQLGGFGN